MPWIDLELLGDNFVSPNDATNRSGIIRGRLESSGYNFFAPTEAGSQPTITKSQLTYPLATPTVDLESLGDNFSVP